MGRPRRSPEQEVEFRDKLDKFMEWANSCVESGKVLRINQDGRQLLQTALEACDELIYIKEKLKKGGATISPSKAEASKNNGRKGGRPVTTGAGLKRRDRQKKVEGNG